MVLISEKAMCMSDYDRRNQLVCWYTDGINLCTHNCYIAEKIEAECKRRNLEYMSVRAREMLVGNHYTHLEYVMNPYSIYKICIAKSLEAYDKKLQKLHADGCVPALKKKQLADWAVTKFNCYGVLEGRYSDAYSVWIQPSSEVPNCISMTLEEREDEVETHWVNIH